MAAKKWIQGAINPEHKGYCTPITKSTCTPRRKALAMRFKKGGDLYAGKRKKKNPHPNRGGYYPLRDEAKGY